LAVVLRNMPPAVDAHAILLLVLLVVIAKAPVPAMVLPLVGTAE